MCGSAERCVSRTYCRSAPAAPMPSDRASAPKPLRSRVPSCSVSRRAALASSKCQGARRRMAVPKRVMSSSAASSASSSSAGFSRSSSPPSAARPAPSRTVKRPAATSSQASPKRLPSRARAATRVSSRSVSSAASVTVPGVTMRTTWRSSGPLEPGTSGSCSQIATLSPRRTSRARYASTAWKGTPAIGIGSPADWPRAVSVMSRSAAARRASS